MTGLEEDTATTIVLSPQDTPGYTHAPGLTHASARRTSELLNVNHNRFHTRFNGGLHNHITHHLLALWALGATPAEIQAMYDHNAPYQAPLEPPDRPERAAVDLADPAVFMACLGRDECYAAFLRFFEREIQTRGVPDTLREYLLKGDARADEVFCRMYTDLVHPMIHLGCAIEFDQPSLLAEALAAACVHDGWPKDFLLPTEAYVRAHPGGPSTPLLEIFDALRRDPQLGAAVDDADPFNKVRDGFLKRVSGEQLTSYLGQWRVRPTPDDLQTKMSEMMHTAAYVLGAAQRPAKRATLDFVLLHSATLAGFYPAILAQDWLRDDEKARLLEAKARVDAVLYASCNCPPLYPRRIADYIPRHPAHGWPELFHRATVYRDEGHAAKLIRALYSLEPLASDTFALPVAKPDFVKIAHMAMDSIEHAIDENGHRMPDTVAEVMAKNIGTGGDMVVSNQKRWVFYGGLEQAWKWVPDIDTRV